jgi:hypothetical protein
MHKGIAEAIALDFSSLKTSLSRWNSARKNLAIQAVVVLPQ